jgi:hypothetical protein
MRGIYPCSPDSGTTLAFRALGTSAGVILTGANPLQTANRKAPPKRGFPGVLQGGEICICVLLICGR